MDKFNYLEKLGIRPNPDMIAEKKSSKCKSSLQSPVHHAVDDEAGAGHRLVHRARRPQHLVGGVVEGAALPPRHLRQWEP